MCSYNEFTWLFHGLPIPCTVMVQGRHVQNVIHRSTLSLPTPIFDAAYTVCLLMSIAVWGAYDPLVFPEVGGALL
jgi:hypothetical protein